LLSRQRGVRGVLPAVRQVEAIAERDAGREAPAASLKSRRRPDLARTSAYRKEIA
jgi:hypothetical protein